MNSLESWQGGLPDISPLWWGVLQCHLLRQSWNGDTGFLSAITLASTLPIPLSVKMNFQSSSRLRFQKPNLCISNEAARERHNGAHRVLRGYLGSSTAGFQNLQRVAVVVTSSRGMWLLSRPVHQPVPKASSVDGGNWTLTWTGLCREPSPQHSH